ncbi:MAG: hypothetical protein JW990_17640 [Thermoleophilia bacterium]|nr:hypothetical protein [Thermoleophilia bacterium]
MLGIDIDHGELTVRNLSTQKGEVRIALPETDYALAGGESVTHALGD